jgi:hypothetical protein
MTKPSSPSKILCHLSRAHPAIWGTPDQAAWRSAWGGMKPPTIVISFDGGEQVAPGSILSFVASLVHESGFQSAEAGFHRCIVLSNFPSSSWIGESRPRREPCGHRQRHIGCRDRCDGSAQDRGGDCRVPEGHRALSRYALPHHNLATSRARKAKPRRRTPRTQRPKNLAQTPRLKCPRF